MYKAGQEVVAISNHPNGKFKKGKIFMVREISKSMCTCIPFLVDIGMSCNGIKTQHCDVCHKTFQNNTPIWWFSSKRFVPIDSKEAEIILEQMEILEHIEINNNCK